jgi:hypothetical protein
MKAREDKHGNPIGDGSRHVGYDVYDFSERGDIKVSVSESVTSESVYVYYRFGDRVATVRYSDHICGGVIDGAYILGGTPYTGKEILAALGFIRKVWRPNAYVEVGQTVKKSRRGEYAMCPLTRAELRAKGVGADIGEYTGMLVEVGEIGTGQSYAPVSGGKVVASDNRYDGEWAYEEAGRA